MGKYRTRPVEAEAYRFDPATFKDGLLPEGIRGIPSPGADSWDYEGCQFFIEWPGGLRLPVRTSDWIVSAEGIQTPMPPDKFHKYYELAEDGEVANG